jgi:hypothetical protein
MKESHKIMLGKYTATTSNILSKKKLTIENYSRMLRGGANQTKATFSKGAAQTHQVIARGAESLMRRGSKYKQIIKSGK